MIVNMRFGTVARLCEELANPTRRELRGEAAVGRLP